MKIGFLFNIRQRSPLVPNGLSPPPAWVGPLSIAMIDIMMLCPILTPARLLPTRFIIFLLLPGLGLGVGEGLGLELGLGLGIQIAISMRGVIIWQGIENGYNTGIVRDSPPRNPPHPNTVFGQKWLMIESA